MKNKETLIFMGIALVVGILVGVIGSNLAGRKEPAPAVSMPQGGAPAAPVGMAQNIKILEDMVAKDPANRNAWVQLGNNYFDSNMPMQSVEAYGKALELNPNDPDVLTDQGIMFRQLGWYDKAAENFKKASQLDPRHLNSLFNLGMLYRDNLNDLPKAMAAWEKYLALNPSGPSADYARTQMELLRQLQPTPNQQ